MNNTPTPHNSAVLGDFAETCIICGDPIRSKYIAENFLDNAHLVNNVRGIQGYTGTYKGKKISVMVHGMGMPSMCIYAHELFNFYNVKNIIRIGTAGGLLPDLKLGDVLVAKTVSTPSNIVENFGFKISDVFSADSMLLKKLKQNALEKNIHTTDGHIVSTDVFYDSDENLKRHIKEGAVAVEMEIAGLYSLAQKFGKSAIAILNVSDKPLEKLYMGADERVTTMNRLISLALDTAECL